MKKTGRQSIPITRETYYRLQFIAISCATKKKRRCKKHRLYNSIKRIACEDHGNYRGDRRPDVSPHEAEPL